MARDDAAQLVRKHWFAIDRLAWRLFLTPIMTGADVVQTLEAADAQWLAAAEGRPDLCPIAFATDTPL